jgi:hypothetical protein
MAMFYMSSYSIIRTTPVGFVTVCLCGSGSRLKFCYDKGDLLAPALIPNQHCNELLYIYNTSAQVYVVVRDYYVYTVDNDISLCIDKYFRKSTVFPTTPMGFWSAILISVYDFIYKC